MPMRRQPSSAAVVLSPEEVARRERNRNKVRRSYYRKIYNLNELRVQVAQLEGEYERILQQQEHATGDHARVRAAAFAPTPTQMSVALADHQDHQLSLLELARVRKSMCQENEALRKRTMEHVKAHGSLQHVLQAKQEEDEKEASIQKQVELMLVKPFTLEECIEITRVSYTEITAFAANQDCVTSGASVCGWKDQRFYQDGVLTYLFKKTFRNCDFDRLVDDTWALLRTPKELARLYSPSLNMSFFRVQEFDENNAIYFRIIDQFDHNVVLKSLFLISRFKTNNGYILLSHGLDPARLDDQFLNFMPPLKEEVWKNVYSWIVLERDGNDCVFSFGGSVKTDNALTMFWLIEVLLVVLRWEAKCVGPLFILQEPDDEEKISGEDPMKLTAWPEDPPTNKY